MSVVLEFLAVGAAGALGAMARLLVSVICGRLFGTGFPIGTLVVNISGSLLLGWFLTRVPARAVGSDTLRLMIAVGFVGAYTTFSTFAYETNALWQSDSSSKAVAYMVGSVVLSLLAVRLGIWLAGR